MIRDEAVVRSWRIIRPLKIYLSTSKSPILSPNAAPSHSPLQATFDSGD
jgi:hypothetical protein